MPDSHLNPDGTVRLDDDEPEPDYAQTAQRHIAAIRAQMGWTQPTPPKPPQNPGECDSRPAIDPPATLPHP